MATQFKQLQTALNTTKTALEAAQTDTTALNGLTKHAVVGDLLQASVQSYFAMNDIQNQLLAQAGKGKIYRMPSYGKFSTNLETAYSWGVPKTVKFSGMMMDMDFMLSIIGNNKNDSAQQKALVQQVGMINSTMEHLIPEQLFSTAENPAYGVSAVKALQLAAAEGQKIYRITQSNVDTALAAINLNSSTEQEIRDAIYAGKEVTTHTHKINYHGMIVAGYVIEDPTNGTGAYKISSGEDGAAIAAEIVNPIGLFLGYLDFKFGLKKILGLLGPVGRFMSTAITILNDIVTVISIASQAVQLTASCLAAGAVMFFMLSSILIGVALVTSSSAGFLTNIAAYIMSIMVDQFMSKWDPVNSLSKLCLENIH